MEGISVRLINYMEDIVEMVYDDVIKDIQVCKCNKCRADMLAITLNSLPTKYVVTKIGETYSKTNILVQQFEVDVISAITKAAEIVAKNPRHDQ